MSTSHLQLKTNDWIRFQERSTHRVLEGYIQAFSPEGDRVLIGKAPQWPENQWYSLDEIEILHHQTPFSTVDEEVLEEDANATDGQGDLS